MVSAALPRSAPAAQGVSSAGVEAFLDALEAAPDVELHSLMLLRHGAVVAEGWWSPYGPEQVHLLYSLSKSFTSTAAGFAADEGLLSFDDAVLSYFPELADAVNHPWTRSMRVRHLAAMATGHREDTLDRAIRLDPADPVRGFLAVEPDQEPGSVFAYNNMATFTLAAIVQRVSGQSLTAYLRPRLLDPLGIEQAYWHRHPAGLELGFSGLHLTTESIARFAQLYLDDGLVGGEQLLPAGWVAEATRLHTPNPAEPNPDWQLGYGFQFWRSRTGYRGDGAYGQFCVVLPDQDTVLVTTAQTENMQAMLDAVWTHLLPGVDHPTPDQDASLRRRLETAALSAGPGIVTTPLEQADSVLAVTEVTADPAGGWWLRVGDGTDQLEVSCGDGSWAITRADLPPDRHLELAASGHRTDRSLAVELVFVATPHRLQVVVDLDSGVSSARWQTIPLHAPTFRGLATGPWA